MRLIQRALKEDDFAWLDVWSLPRPFKASGPVTREAPRPGASELEAAARSMCAYVFHASQLLVVASSQEDFEEVLRRAWCQAELFAAMCPVVRRESVTSAGSSFSLCTRVLRHACKAEALLGNSRDQWHGGDDLELMPLSFTLLQDPLCCQIVDPNDMLLLQQLLQSIRKALL